MIDELAVAKTAFINAHGRFLNGHAGKDAELWFAGLSETVWWIAALDDYYEAHFSSYAAFRDSSAYGCFIPGIKLARHKAIHELLLLVDYDYALRQKGVVDLTQLHWRSNLSGIGDIRSAKQKACFETYLAGHAVRYALRSANKFYIRQKDHLDQNI
jgi:hypothetical protein